MPSPGDLLHSARAGGVDVLEASELKALCVTRSAAEPHALCSSANVFQQRSDRRSPRVREGY